VEEATMLSAIFADTRHGHQFFPSGIIKCPGLCKFRQRWRLFPDMSYAERKQQRGRLVCLLFPQPEMLSALFRLSFPAGRLFFLSFSDRGRRIFHQFFFQQYLDEFSRRRGYPSRRARQTIQSVLHLADKRLLQ